MKKIIKHIIGMALLVCAVVGCVSGYTPDSVDSALIWSSYSGPVIFPMPRSITQKEEIFDFSVFDNVNEEISEGLIGHSEGYKINFTKSGIDVKAEDEAGAFYARQTLSQLKAEFQGVAITPGFEIIDWPDFPNRGVMLDISRDKVPTMETLYSMVDKFASIKINQLQLYTEHTFAYKNHSKVWENASPMTASQIKDLDKYCKSKFIRLIANQNSFGHMNRWLKHDEYKHLAECEDPVNSSWGMRSRNILSPAAEGSIKLVQELFAELLPNFSTKIVNVGCDETVELGLGKSKALSRKKGKGRVYLDFLKQIHSAAADNGFTVQFWGDIILHHPELISELPTDMTAMVWGYEGNHAFDYQCSKFKDAGVNFYVCPGTSTWNSITGRFSNMKENLLNAAVNGHKYGADGFLNTNWGDYGHWQPLLFCWSGYFYGAGVSWNAQNNAWADLDLLLSKFIFEDKSVEAAELVNKLSDIYKATGVEIGNDTVLHNNLRHPAESLNSIHWGSKISAVKFNSVANKIAELNREFQALELNCEEAELIKEEYDFASRLLIHSCRLGEAKASVSGKSLKNVPSEKKAVLKSDMKKIIALHKKLWVRRNRVGGLSDSVLKLEKVLEAYGD
jgi:hypothetical protein